MAMCVFLECVAHYVGLTTRAPRHLHVPLVFLCLGQRTGGSKPGVSIPIQAVSSMPVRELAERRLVQEMARRRARTSAWDVDFPRRSYSRSPDRSGPSCFRVVSGDVARRRRRNGVSQLPSNVSCVHLSLPSSCSYSPSGEPGSTQIRSATYCCGGTSDLLLLCAFQRRPTLSNVFFGRHATSTGYILNLERMRHQSM